MNSVKFEEFLDRVRELLYAKGVPRVIVEQFISDMDEYIKSVYEKTGYKDPLLALGEISIYFVRNYIPEKFTLVNAMFLRASGVDVRHAYVRLVHATSSFISWLNNLRERGWRVEEKLVYIRPGKTNIILDPDTPIEYFTVALRGLTIALTNTQALIYIIDHEEKSLEYYFYPKCDLLGEIIEP
jgi:hypothetical protein